MNEDSRYRRAVRAVWERSHGEYRQWPAAKREAAQRAVDALLAWLDGAHDEDDLVTRYWEAGDAPGNVLRLHLPPELDEDDLLAIEEACFWLCLRTLLDDR